MVGKTPLISKLLFNCPCTFLIIFINPSTPRNAKYSQAIGRITWSAAVIEFKVNKPKDG
jgi:hypothetical protein